MRRLFEEEMVERGGMYLLKFNKLQSYLITVPELEFLKSLWGLGTEKE